MKKITSLITAAALLLLIFTGCKGENNTTAKVGGESSDISLESEQSTINAKSDMFTDNDLNTDYNESAAVKIELNKNTAVASSDSVIIQDSVITITEEATYIISGELENGTLIVDAPESTKPHLIFNGVKITSESFAALYINQADKVFITLNENSENSLLCGNEFTLIEGANVDAALFSKQDLTLNGSGYLTVTSPAGHGITCKDDLVITGGNYIINAAFHGLDANDSIRILNAALNIDAGKDAIHSENTDDTSLGYIYIENGKISAEMNGDGISAGAFMQIISATVNLTVGGGAENGTKAYSEGYGGFMGRGPSMRPDATGTDSANTDDAVSMKGLKAAGNLEILGGSFSINSADDSIHSNSSITVNDGTFTLSSGDDAIHADDTLNINAGTINISESYEGLEALYINIYGGNVTLTATDDGINAAGGNDQSGELGGRDGMFNGAMGGKPNGMGGHNPMGSSDNGAIKIHGGTVYINASGDGLDANGTIEISGGDITVVGPIHGDTSTLDYDKSAIITGGTFIGTGASGMAQTFSDSEQGVIALSTGNQIADTKITLTDKNSNTIIEYTPALDFAVVILSCPEIKKGETYTIAIGSEKAEIEAY